MWGIFYSKFKVGDMVRKDEVVGYMIDEFGKIIEEYKFLKDGVILYMLVILFINEDDMVMCISFLNEDEK